MSPNIRFRKPIDKTFPQKLEEKLAAYKRQGLFPPFPFGTDLSKDEQTLGKALKGVKAAAAKTSKWKLALDAWRFDEARIPANARPYLDWLKLSKPKSMQDKVVRMLLIEELRAAGAI